MLCVDDLLMLCVDDLLMLCVDDLLMLCVDDLLMLCVDDLNVPAGCSGVPLLPSISLLVSAAAD